MRKIVWLLVVVMSWPGRLLLGQKTLERHYVDGAVSQYEMVGDNDGWKYRVLATITSRRDADGKYYEEIAWSDFSSNGQQTLNPASLAMRQTVSLTDPATYMKLPNLAQVQPFLIGPITDTLTFYSDLLLAMQQNLSRAGQTAYVPRSTPNSWADGQHVLLGQDAVDFRFKVDAVDAAAHTETLLIDHVPPPELHVELPARWMQEPGAKTPRNWVQVSNQDGKYDAEVGKETFAIRMVVDTRDGHMLSAEIRNPVEASVRTCTDKELASCGPATAKTILRVVTWKQIDK